MVATAVVVFGLLSFERLPIDFLPEISYPSVTVRTEFPGAAPLEVEAEATRPIEEVLATVEGLITLRSVSRAEVSEVVLELDWSTDMDQAVQEVREKLDLVPFDPDEVERPLVLRYDPDDEPVIRVGLSGGQDEFVLRSFADDVLRPELEGLTGVAAARVRGGRIREVRVSLSETALLRHGLTATEVATRLGAESVNLPGGRLEEGEVRYLVRTLGEFETAEEVADVVVLRRGDASLRVSDLGTVRVVPEDRRMLTRVDGDASVVLEVYREAGANLVAVADSVRDAVAPLLDPEIVRAVQAGLKLKQAPKGEKRGRGKPDDLSPAERLKPSARRMVRSLPSGTRVVVLGDRAAFIRAAIDEVQQTLVIGGLLAIIILFLFLGSLRPTVVISLSIPLSLIATFALLHLFGVSLNLMSLGGLVLGVGMLVDNSIVVMESVQRCREEGDDTLTAAVRGTREVSVAVTAATLTTICVFFPVVFVTGIAGQLFGDLALAVVFSLSASLVVALTFVPMAAAREGLSALATLGEGGEEAEVTRASALLRRPTAWAAAAGAFVLRQLIRMVLLLFKVVVAVLLVLTWPARAAASAVSAVLGLLQRGYPVLLRAALRHPVLVAIVVAAIAWPVPRIVGSLGAELIPTVHMGELGLRIELSPGTPLEETSRIARPVEAKLATLEVVSSVSTSIGNDGEQSSAEAGEHIATLTVQVKGGAEVAVQEQAVIREARRLVADIPGARFRLARPALFTFRTPIEVIAWGPELPALRRFSAGLADALSELPALRDVQAQLAPPIPEIQIRYDREQLTRFGLSIEEVAREVRNKIEGRAPSHISQRGERIDIRVQLDERSLTSVQDLERLTIANSDVGAAGGEAALAGMLAGEGAADAMPARPIPLSSVAKIDVVDGPSEIHHMDGRRAVRVAADVSGFDLQGAAAGVRDRLRSLPRPAEIDLALSGQNEEMNESLRSLWWALLLAAFLVYVIMASTFESFMAPLSIMFTVPLGLVGAVVGLWAAGLSVSVIAAVGAITLTGIVVNNAIVLIDYAGRLRQRGLEATEAILQAGRTRLRPILITTATTVLGLTPMALSTGEGAEIRLPVAATVIAGLLLSTALTLVVIPVLYRVLVRRVRVE